MEDQAILMRQGTSPTPLFLLHDEEGLLDYAKVLSAHLDPQLTVYGLPLNAAGSGAMTTVQGMATQLIVRMRQVQPKGPYRLAGWSFGGVLAYEMATQLVGQDVAVEFLGLIEAAYGLDRTATSQSESPVKRAAQAASAQYFGQPLRINVHLLTAKEEAPANPRLGWQALIDDKHLRVMPLAGTHATLLTSPHVEAMGKALSTAMKESTGSSRGQLQRYSPKVTLQTGKPGVTPLFCVPGAGASIVSFTELVGILDPSWPVHGLQPRGLDGLHLPHTTLASHVDNCMQAVQEAQPRGPVRLLGHSFGGWVVMEMAHHLKAMGREVVSLSIIDTEAPGELFRHQTHHELLDKWFEIFEMIIERPLGLSVDHLATLPFADQLALVHEKLTQVGIMPKKSQPDLLRGPLAAFAAALRAPCPPARVYNGPLQLVYVDDAKLSPETNQENGEKLVEDWRQWAPQLTALHGPGNHMTALKMPHIQTIARWLWSA